VAQPLPNFFDYSKDKKMLQGYQSQNLTFIGML